MFFMKGFLISALACITVYSGTCQAFYSSFSNNRVTESISTGLLPTDLENVAFYLGAAPEEYGYTLSSITISETDKIDILSGTIQNTASNTESFRLQQTTDFSESSNNSALDNLLNIISGSLVFSYNPTSFSTVATGSAISFGSQIRLVSNSTRAITNGAIFNLLNVGGTGETIDVSTLTYDTMIGGGGNLVTSINTNAEINYTIVFDYSTTVSDPPNITAVKSASVAEPSSLGLWFCVGLLYMLFSRKELFG
jgi:hypothetical protein